MMFRSMMFGALLVLSVGCRVTTKVDAGCVGITCPTGGGVGAGGGTGGSTGGGTGGSTGGSGGSIGGGSGGGTVSDGGVATTITAAKGSTYPAKVALQGVVVTAVSFARKSTSTCAGTTPGVNASFWVADPSNSEIGVWVEKFHCDGDVEYFPQVGDILNVSGVIGFESNFQHQEGFRVMVKSQYDYISGKPQGYVCAATSTPPCEPFIVTKTGSMAALPVPSKPITFGGGSGAIKAEQGLRGARIKIDGPLTVADINPNFMHRVSALGAADNVYYGFELSNGVLVNNFRTRDGAALEDGGISHCDVRWIVGDGGTVTFPNGIVGVWDTYTMSPCEDGGTNPYCGRNIKGFVPGADAGVTYTNVLYPTDCADLTP